MVNGTNENSSKRHRDDTIREVCIGHAEHGNRADSEV